MVAEFKPGKASVRMPANAQFIVTWSFSGRSDVTVQLMRRWFQEVWNEGKTESIHEFLAPDAIGIGELEDGRPLRGPAEFVPFVERIRGAFLDINSVVEDAFGAEDKVVLRWSATMTHSRRSSGNACQRAAGANSRNEQRSRSR
jgi:SnoaL-like polyketide cyclase